MEYKDYYEIMGVARDATQDEIKRTYRKLARKYHPDVSKESDAEERFKSLGEAYEVLKDPEKRAAYDQLGANWQGGQDFNAPPDWDAGFEFSGGGFTGGDSTDYSDFFESLFGQARAARGGGRRAGFHARGQDRHAKILVDLGDSFSGATRAINLQVPELTPDGHVTTRTRTLNIKIPKGIREGQKIRLTGQGDPGAGKAGAGDLYLEIDFKPHPLYRAEAHDLYLDLPVAPWEAVLGATVKVPTPEGVVELKVPAGSAQGKKMRLKGRGIPAKQPGDLYVVLQIALPEADTAAAKKLYQQMQDELNFNPRRRMGVEA
ncbi:MAG: DnaJ domain-containing protein [Gammaproteobacteria bacterium]|jgi:curved DNA-binding protein|nr:DnaJ domain-containing protein [Gammaproteobacteria bacterium]